MIGGEEVLHEGDGGRRVVRLGDRVLRPTYPSSRSVHGLLAHLEWVGFDGAPRFLGIEPDGREALSYIPGDANGRVDRLEAIHRQMLAIVESLP